jgi:hypothetical protein
MLAIYDIAIKLASNPGRLQAFHFLGFVKTAKTIKNKNS